MKQISTLNENGEFCTSTKKIKISLPELQSIFIQKLRIPDKGVNTFHNYCKIVRDVIYSECKLHNGQEVVHLIVYPESETDNAEVKEILFLILEFHTRVKPYRDVANEFKVTFLSGLTVYKVLHVLFLIDSITRRIQDNLLDDFTLMVIYKLFDTETLPHLLSPRTPVTEGPYVVVGIPIPENA